MLCLPKMCNLKLIMSEHQTKPSQQPLYKITGQYASKLCKKQRKTKELSPIKGNQGVMTTKCFRILDWI